MGPSSDTPTIERVLVINLDRERRRWLRVVKELSRFRSRDGATLDRLASRLPAVDGRQLGREDHLPHVVRSYALADQLAVEPNPLIGDDPRVLDITINMSDAEVAVALSHIGAWRTVAGGGRGFTLVLEDDVVLDHGFARKLDVAWSEVVTRSAAGQPPDLVYLSYDAVGEAATQQASKGPVFEPSMGLWHLSGYVLSAVGAQCLLSRLPVRGPVDLWLNHQFGDLSVIATNVPIITQRPDLPSTNYYSALPALLRTGGLKYKTTALPDRSRRRGPVFGFGAPGSGVTALASALSILGYRCLSDLDDVPASERRALASRLRRRMFDAYVNIAALTPDHCEGLARASPSARFIVTVPCTRGDAGWACSGDDCQGQADAWPNSDPLVARRMLVLPACTSDKWAALCRFLGTEYPAAYYPNVIDRAPRALAHQPTTAAQRSRIGRQLRGDRSPWVARGRRWPGIRLAQSTTDAHQVTTMLGPVSLDDCRWQARDDTFPDNLAVFRSDGVLEPSDHDGPLRLRMTEGHDRVRQYTSGAIVTTKAFRYGRFSAELRPPGVSGTVTGVFLHRDLPRQEIDVEFLGDKPSRMLVNVFYNPGCPGTRLQYGYRGAPALVDLGFDASRDFHRYEIEWLPGTIRWLVDGHVMHERTLWDPTPIPNQPMSFNVNLWASRSSRLAGRVAAEDLPVDAHVRTVGIPSHWTR